jgi:hypothetical protein
MTNKSYSLAALENFHKEKLEEDIIGILATKKQLDLRVAMKLYYNSKLSKQISEGVFGIQYLDANYLVADLLENESAIFV